MISIRMRASKKEVHISGAEGIYPSLDDGTIAGYVRRAMGHPRGAPDKISITIETIKGRPRKAGTLPITTLECKSVADAKRAIEKLLLASGISAKAIETGFGVVYGRKVMRGAALVRAGSGKRIESDKQRGVRAKCFGISPAAEKKLTLELRQGGIDNGTVKEALMLASKVASCGDIAAELCISDDPDYTTGYIASKACGYLRIPHIKEKGRRNGGRIFFVKDRADPACIIEYLERTPVMIGRVAQNRGIRSIDEVLGHNL